MEPPSDSLAQTCPPPHARQEEEKLMRRTLWTSLSPRVIRIITEILPVRRRNKFTREIFSYCEYGKAVRPLLKLIFTWWSQILVRSGVILTLILLSLAFLYVFVSNWKVYEVSLQAKGGDTKRETRPPSERGTTRLQLGNSLVTAVLAPISTKPSPSQSQPESGPHIVTINVVAGGETTDHPSHSLR